MEYPVIQIFAFTCIVMTFDSSPGSNRSSASVLLAASASSMPISAASALTLATGSRAPPSSRARCARSVAAPGRGFPGAGRAPGRAGSGDLP